MCRTDSRLINLANCCGAFDCVYVSSSISKHTNTIDRMLLYARNRASSHI